MTGFFDNNPIGLEKEEMNILMREWSNRLTDSWEKEHVEEALSEFYLFVKNNKGWRSYIGQQLAQTKREVVRNVLKEWDEPLMLLAEITEADTDFIHVKTLFGDSTFKMTRNEGMPADIGTLLFGVVLRDSRKGENAIAPVSAMLFLAKWSKQTKKSLIELRDSVSEKHWNNLLVTMRSIFTNSSLKEVWHR